MIGLRPGKELALKLVYWLMVLVVVLTVVGAARDVGANPGVCQPQDEHVHPVLDTDEVTVVASSGRLITGYCVKAGSVHQGLGPEYVYFDDPVGSVTISHSSGKDISHYVVFFVDVPSTTVPSTTVPSTTVPSTTVPSTTVPSTTVPSTTVPVTSTTVPPSVPPETPPGVPVPEVPKFTG